MRQIAILGSTGSIGTSALDVIRRHPDRLSAIALTAHRRWEVLVRQAWEFRPRFVALSDPAAARKADPAQLPPGTSFLRGSDALSEIAVHEDVDTVLVAIVGAAGLRSTWAAAEQGKTIAIANKETLVLAGPLIVDLARRHRATLLPVDSEHSAIFQCLSAGRREEVARIILTASGGPFRTWTREELEQATVEQALQHPTWAMGPKITIDSATMMNKALEIVEARWLFDFPPERITVVIHPQSIVHSLVEFQDGAVIAQMSPPDMRLPIQFALFYPDRLPGPARKMNWAVPYCLEFEPADTERFPALRLGYRVAAAGGTAGAVLNAANEVAVERFLRRELGFLDILRLVEAVLDEHKVEYPDALQPLLDADAWARRRARQWHPPARAYSAPPL